MGLFGIDSTSTASQTTTQASDQGSAVRGGKVLRDNATDLSNAKVNTGTSVKGNVNTGITAAKGSTVNIQGDSGPEVTNLTNAFLQAITGVSANTAAAAAGGGGGSAPIVIQTPTTAGTENGSSALNDIVSRSLNQADTGSQAATSSSVSWWLIGGAVVLVGIVAAVIWKKK